MTTGLSVGIAHELTRPGWPDIDIDAGQVGILTVLLSNKSALQQMHAIQEGSNWLYQGIHPLLRGMVSAALEDPEKIQMCEVSISAYEALGGLLLPGQYYAAKGREQIARLAFGGERQVDFTDQINASLSSAAEKIPNTLIVISEVVAGHTGYESNSWAIGVAALMSDIQNNANELPDVA